MYRTTTLYFADKPSAGLREVASIAIPTSIQSAAASAFLGWRNDTAFFELRCPTGSECGSHLARWIYRAPIDGSLERLDSSASPLASVPNVVWHWGDTVSFRANTHNIPVLALSPEGTLTVARPPGARRAAILGPWAGERWRLNANPTYGILRAPCRTVTIVGPLSADDSGNFRSPAVGQLSNVVNTLDSLPAELTVTGHLSSAIKARTLRLVIAPAYNPPPYGPNWSDTLDVIEGRLRDITCP